MSDLPSRKERAWLLRGLRGLVEKRGAEAFCRSPLVEPSPRYFPEPWSPEVQGAESITRRLLDYAGLDALAIELYSFVDYDPSRDGEGEGDETSAHRGTAGWFAGIEEGRCLFGINVSQLDRPERLSGVMAHEVAHAYRRLHGLEDADREVEEKLTDLTTIYLGFGALTCTNTRRADLLREHGAVGIERTGAGYLSLEAMCFLFAAQVVARGYDKRGRDRLAKALGSAQAYHFRRAFDDLSGDRHALLERLGLSAAEASKGPRPSPARAPARHDHPATGGVPWGRYAYRAKTAQPKMWGVAGLGAGLVLSLPLVRSLGPVVAVLIPATMVLGYALGAFDKRATCSDPACGAPLPPGADACPSCARMLLGDLFEPPMKFATGENRGRTVYRLVGNMSMRGMVLGMMIGLSAAILLTSFGLGGSDLVLFSAAGGVIGWALGRRRLRYFCSERDCDGVLEPFLRECPRCLGEIGAPPP